MFKKLTLLVATGSLLTAQGCTVPSVSEEIEEVASTSQAISSACNTNSGILPTKASLAVAMANELKRWDPATDLVRVSDTVGVGLSSAGQARCNANGGCPNTLALLSLQSDSVRNVIDQNVFNPTAYRQDLIASLDRQIAKTNDLKMNYPWLVPEEHVLVKVLGPTNLGACGPHYLYQPLKPNGTLLNNPANLQYNLWFFGQPDNPFIAFVYQNGNVGIDPTDGDNSTPIPSSGCPTYQLDRVYNPSGSLAGSCCTSVQGWLGTMVSIGSGYYGCKQTTTSTTEPCTPQKTVSGGSFMLNTTGAYCFRTADTIKGWGCSNFDGRTLKVNTVTKTCGGTLPAKVNNYYYFDVSAGTYSWAQLNWW